MSIFRRIKSRVGRRAKRTSPDELRRRQLERLLIARDLEAIRDLRNITDQPNDHDVSVYAMLDQLDYEGDFTFLHAHNFAGNLDHYHHFFGAVVLPFFELISLGYTNKEMTYFVQKCGPLSSELQEIADFYEMKIKFYPACLRDLAVNLKKVTHIHLPSYDYSYHTDWWLKPHQVEAIRRVALPISSFKSYANKEDRYKILLVDRAPPADYYSSPEATTGNSGATRRSVPNMDEVEVILEADYSVERVFLEHHSLAEKMNFFHSADIVVGQMGAGLNGLLWMKPGASLVEVHPLDEIRRDYAAYGNMAKELSILHYRIIQGQPHAAVNIDLVVAYIKQAVRDMRSISLALES